ncbi:MAG: hypothetical protein ACTSYL_10760 [Candidatus Thorarchaeota archaeon]
MESGYRGSILGLPIMLLYVWAFYVSGPPWNSTLGATAIYSALAFLCVTLTVSLVNLLRTQNTIANQILTGVATYGFLIFAGSAISNIWRANNSVVHAQTSGVFLNLIALTVAGILLLAYSILVDRPVQGEIRGITKYLAVIVALVGISISIIFTLIIQAEIVESIFLVGGYLIAAIASVSYLSAGLLIIRKRQTITVNDSVRLSIAIWFLGISTIIHTLILAVPSGLWLLSMGFIAMGFIYAITGITVPYLISIGVDSKRSYIFAVGINVVVLGPFLVAYLLDYLTIGFSFIDVGLTMSIHISAAFLAAGAGFVLHMRARKSPAAWHSPIILLLLFWAVAEIEVGISPITLGYANTETLVPYITGSVIATLLLIFAYKNTFSPRLSENLCRSKLFFGIMTIVFVFLLALAQFIRDLIFQLLPNLSQATFVQSALATSFMISFSYLSLFALLNLFFALITMSGGKFTFDTNIASLSAIWVVVVILRANFAIWSTGWWLTEFLLYATAMSCIMIVLKRYVYEVKITKEFEERVLIQKELLSTNLLSQIQTVAKSIELLGRTEDIDTRLDIMSQALSDLSRAESITQNIDILLSEESFSPVTLLPVDLVDVLKFVFTPKYCGCAPDISQVRGEHFVLANDLLVDAISNVIGLIVARIGSINSANIELTQRPGDDLTYVVASMDLTVLTKDATKKQNLLLRYTGTTPHEAVEIAYARRLISLFGGSIMISPNTLDESNLSIKIEISLIAASKE